MLANLQMRKAKAASTLSSTQKKHKTWISTDVRGLIYTYLNPKELITLIAKLSKSERNFLREARDGCAYALSSSINARKPYMANSFQSSMQTIQSSLWYNNSQNQSNNEIFKIVIPKIPLSKFCQASVKHGNQISSPTNST